MKKLFAIGLTLLAMAAANLEDIFIQHEVIPDVIATSPKQLLKIVYNNVLAEQGLELTPTQVKSQPTVEWNAEADALYTLIMTDPDAPSRAEPKFREFNHWLVVNIPGKDVDKGEVIRAYVGSGPPKDTGLHRYVFLVYKQPNKLEFDEEHVGDNSRTDRPKFKAADFAKKYSLQDLVAANFYQAQWDEYVPIQQKKLSGN